MQPAQDSKHYRVDSIVIKEIKKMFHLLMECTRDTAVIIETCIYDRVCVCVCIYCPHRETNRPKPTVFISLF